MRPDLARPKITEPTTAKSDTVAAEYRLGFGDVIEVKFFNNNQFNETLTVRPDGRISMQKIGDIVVAGMTPTELSQYITRAYSRIIKDPEVTVIVRNFGGYQVYVLGEVKSPGAFPLQRNLTVLQSLALAGGQKESATLKSILLIRRRPDGSTDARRIDLSNTAPGMIQKNDIPLEAQDIIYVPKTFIANINTFLDQAFSGLIPPLDIYLRAVWWNRW
ncbi:MAG: polysaccharide export protein [candidate division KSB1 bacterium]|nr:polysaccharide export protein [candidate division KSB1 bacterium]MDZ7358328.1 polysaccharide export protein [candidate division KSB1 bacterium]MDZ7399636.1 polysaccharide export protein [candidate division KSB1 bacterium]